MLYRVGRTKQQRFQDNAQNPCLLEPGKPMYLHMRGAWSKHHFRNENPITLELGCGHGEQSLAMAKAYPERNFIGLDLKGSRLWTGSQKAYHERLSNLVFLRASAQDIASFFAPHEVHELWLTFPDPYPKTRHEKKRLTAPFFWMEYKSIMHNEGWVHLKTDAYALFTYTLEVLLALEEEKHIRDRYVCKDLHAVSEHLAYARFVTNYEARFRQQGLPIMYLKCRFA